MSFHVTSDIVSKGDFMIILICSELDFKSPKIKKAREFRVDDLELISLMTIDQSSGGFPFSSNILRLVTTTATKEVGLGRHQDISLYCSCLSECRSM